MLRELYIENLAIIEKAVIPFEQRMNVFTGETGAGKSILIGGINAVLGGRVSKDIVRAGAAKATITALFDSVPAAVSQKLSDYGYECGEELMLQREISADGKSTARINGRTATVAVLKEAAGGLIDIHGQHDNQMLLSSDRQRELLDSYGGYSDKLSEYAENFRAFSQLSRQIKKLQAEDSEKEYKMAVLREKIEEVSSYRFAKGEEERVTKTLEAARSRERIQRSLNTAYVSLSGSDEDNGALDLIKTASSSLAEISDVVDCGELKTRLDSLTIDLDDICGEVASLFSENSESSGSVTELEERMSDILRLKRKYGLDIDELLAELDEWTAALEELEDADDKVEELSEKRHELAELVKSQAAELTALRRETSERLTARVAETLTYLDMPNVKLIFAITQDKVTVSGMDSVEMLISVNKGEEPKPVSKIASGGELSRIMLAIKSELADKEETPTMIFDEIDTGISGRAASKVGVKLSEIGTTRQVLCVTHLAQIAAVADYHLLIEKKSDESRTYTSVTPLDFEGRKKEIARIISGDSDNEISLKNAEELLGRKHAVG